MGFQCGIVGLQNVGKSTIFNALTSNKADASNVPFCTTEPSLGPQPRRRIHDRERQGCAPFSAGIGSLIEPTVAHRPRATGYPSEVF